MFDLFDNFFYDTYTEGPRVNVYEDQGEYGIEFMVPGITKDEVSVSTSDDNTLDITIKPEKHQERVKGRRWYKREYSFLGKQYSQQIYLPEDSEVSGINAKVKDGILTITIPKKKPKEPESHTISIE